MTKDIFWIYLLSDIQIRNPKHEIRNKFEYQMTEFSKLKWIDS